MVRLLGSLGIAAVLLVTFLLTDVLARGGASRGGGHRVEGIPASSPTQNATEPMSSHIIEPPATQHNVTILVAGRT
jgi:hypothetical protein